MPDSPAPKRIRPIWLASYPRSGNTFLRIILQNIFRLPTYSVYNVEGQNYSDPSAEALEEAPFLPANWRESVDRGPQGEVTLIKTHDPPEDEAPAVYIIRDGRAAIDSYFHYHQKFAFEKPSLTEVIAGVCQFGGWSDHYRAWKPSSRPKTLLVRYEELVTHPNEIIPQLGAFLGQKPLEGQLPSFEQLKQQYPAFFRRGQNQDFITNWTPGQMGLFNLLHGPVMEELHYPLSSEPHLESSTTKELARSAAQFHELYLQQLRKLGESAAMGQHLATQLEDVSKKLQTAQGDLAEKERALSFLLRQWWVRLGMAMGALRRKARKGESRHKLTSAEAD